MQQLLIEIAHAAQMRFANKPIRIWYAMLGQNSWKAFIINTESKMKLAESVVKPSRESALTALKNKLESQVKRTQNV